MGDFKVVATYQDSHGRYLKKHVDVESADISAVVTDFAAWQSAYEAITEAAYRRGNALYNLGGGAAAPTAGSNKDVGATFTGQTSSGKIVTLKVQAFDSSYADAYGNIDLTDVDIAAFLALYEAAGICTLSDGDVVAVWLSGTLDE